MDHGWPILTLAAGAAFDFPLIETLAAAFAAAWVMGLLTQKIGLSPIVGYLLAGVIIGPHTPGFVADVDLAPQLAELGVILLMFGVGLHFHVGDLMKVRNIAIPGAIAQSVTATVAGVLIFLLFDLPVSAGLVLGMAMAVASTVVLIRVLTDFNRLHTAAGHTAVGWLIVEDIFTVIILVMIPALAVSAPGSASAEAATGPHWTVALLIAMAKLVGMVLVLYVVGSRIVPWVLVTVTRLRSRELFTLTVLVLSIAVATGAAVLFGASVALGAFLAGMVVAQSPVSQQAGIDALPMRDAFAVLFFVAVGMLLNPMFLVEQPLLVAAGLAIVMIAKPLAALAIVVVLGHPMRTALTVAIALAQIGEFSFIVGQLALKYDLLPETGMNILVATALVSITVNPLLFRLVEPIEEWLRRRPALWAKLNRRADRRARKLNVDAQRQVRRIDDEDKLAIVAGYGPVGRQVDRLLREAGLQTVVIDLNIDTVTALAEEGRTAIYGDATRSELLEQAGIEKASYLLLTAPHTPNYHMLVPEVRRMNPKIRLIIRTRYLREAEAFHQVDAGTTVVDELESAAALTELVLKETNAEAHCIPTEVQQLRKSMSRNSEHNDKPSQ